MAVEAPVILSPKDLDHFKHDGAISLHSVGAALESVAPKPFVEALVTLRARLVLTLAAALIGSTLLVFAQQPKPTSAKPAAAAAKPSPQIERGAYLLAIMACDDCHTPFKMGKNGPEPDMSRRLSGHPDTVKIPPPPPAQGPWVGHSIGTNTAFAGPWGVSYSMNITPDPTGIGAWTEEAFVRAIKSGKHVGASRPILPPMPWPAYSRATDADLKAIYAYLRTVKPIRNNPPQSVMAPPPAVKR